MNRGLAGLRADPCARHLTGEQLRWYARHAIALGRCAAAPYAGREPLALAAEWGLRVELVDRPSRVAGATVHAEYDREARTITVYQASLDALAARLGPEAALARHVAHELYHHLEATTLGATEDRLPPVVINPGRWARRQRFRACSEVAAEAFAEALTGR